jgi:hypothetical protein
MSCGDSIAHRAFDKRILPRRRRRDHDLFDTHPLNPSAENWTLRRVAVSHQIPR